MQEEKGGDAGKPEETRQQGTESKEAFSRDASYRIYFNEDGAYIEITSEIGQGLPVQADWVMFDLNRRNIQDAKPAEIAFKIRKGENPVKISDVHEEKTVDTGVYVKTDKNDMTAWMVLFPPSKDGGKKSAQQVLDEIRNTWEVTYGIDEEAVKYAVEGERYCERIEIAKGRLPEKGKDGTLTFLFKMEHSCAPHIQEDGSADYKNLNIFESVSEGDAVVVRILPEEGVSGMTVKGRELPALRGLEAKLPKGKNTRVSEDGLSLLAAKSGRVDLIGGRVEISDLFRISGDVDMSTGNIDFVGDIYIQGNVISGLTVKTTGNIEVHGSVEGAALVAGKDIILKNGIQGMDRGVLKAGGNVVSRFIERSHVEAGGSVYSDFIVHSTVAAQDSVVMKGKRGKIIGGTIRAGKEIIARFVGSVSGDLTQIELGVSPELRVKLADMEAKRGQLKVQMDKIENVVRVLPAREDSPERMAMRQKLLESYEQLKNHYSEMVREIDDIKMKLSVLSGGRLHVFGTLYQDVKVVIDSCAHINKTSTDYVTLKYREGEIVFSACEIKQN